MLRTLSILLLVAVLLTGWVAVSIYLPYQHFPSQGIFVDIPHGASRRTVARLLANQGVVRSRWVFEGLSRWRSRRTLQAGEYYFDHPMTGLQVFDTIASGRVYVRELVIPEGLSMFDIADLVQREDFTTRDDFLAAARNPGLIRDLAPNAPSLEGFLFPATYEFPRHPTGEQMVTAMVSHFRQEWAAIRAGQPNLSGLAIEQVVTLASLVERETPKAEERPMVAGVFINRLTGMFRCSATRLSFMRWNWQGFTLENLRRPTCPSIRRITPIAVPGCLPVLSPTPAALRWKLRSILRRPTTSILSPIRKAAIFSAEPSLSTITTWRFIAGGWPPSAAPPRRTIRRPRRSRLPFLPLHQPS